MIRNTVLLHPKYHKQVAKKQKITISVKNLKSKVHTRNAIKIKISCSIKMNCKKNWNLSKKKLRKIKTQPKKTSKNTSEPHQPSHWASKPQEETSPNPKMETSERPVTQEKGWPREKPVIWEKRRFQCTTGAIMEIVERAVVWTWRNKKASSDWWVNIFCLFYVLVINWKHIRFVRIVRFVSCQM